MTLNQVKTWIRKSKPGDQFVYRTGKQLASAPGVADYSDAVHAIRHYYNLGYVHLVQRRIEGGFFQYTAVRKGAVAPPLPAFSLEGTAVHKFRVPRSIVAGL